jgi:hypothetical protein
VIWWPRAGEGKVEARRVDLTAIRGLQMHGIEQPLVAPDPYVKPAKPAKSAKSSKSAKSAIRHPHRPGPLDAMFMQPSLHAGNPLLPASTFPSPSWISTSHSGEFFHFCHFEVLRSCDGVPRFAPPFREDSPMRSISRIADRLQIRTLRSFEYFGPAISFFQI